MFHVQEPNEGLGFLFRILEIRSSNLGPYRGYSDLDHLGFPQILK